MKPVNFKITLWGIRIGIVRQYGPHEFKAFVYPRLPQAQSGLVKFFINGQMIFAQPLGDFTSLNLATDAIAICDGRARRKATS
jgi:hypothetical protein